MVLIDIVMNAARIARSPCARFTNRITPNDSDRPVANSAYRPPSRMPWMIALTQVTQAALRESSERSSETSSERRASR